MNQRLWNIVCYTSRLWMCLNLFCVSLQRHRKTHSFSSSTVVLLRLRWLLILTIIHKHERHSFNYSKLWLFGVLFCLVLSYSAHCHLLHVEIVQLSYKYCIIILIKNLIKKCNRSIFIAPLWDNNKQKVCEFWFCLPFFNTKTDCDSSLLKYLYWRKVKVGWTVSLIYHVRWDL